MVKTSRKEAYTIRRRAMHLRLRQRGVANKRISLRLLNTCSGESGSPVPDWCPHSVTLPVGLKAA